MINSLPFDSLPRFFIINIRHKRLDLKFQSSSSWQLDIIIFVEHYRNIIKGLSIIHLFSTVKLQYLSFFRVEVETLAYESLKSLIFCKDKEVNTKHSIYLGIQVLKVNFCKVPNLELNTSRHIDFVFLPLHLHNSVTVLYLWSKLLSSR